MTLRCSGWRYSTPNASVYGFGPAFESLEDAVACAAAHLGVPVASFEEPFLPLSMDALAADAYERKVNLAVVDDGTWVLAHAPLPDQVEWPPRPWGFRSPGE